MARVVQLLLFCTNVALTLGGASNSSADPLGKAEEMLCDMMKQIKIDGVRDANAFALFEMKAKLFIRITEENITKVSQTAARLHNESAIMETEVKTLQQRTTECTTTLTKTQAMEEKLELDWKQHHEQYVQQQKSLDTSVTELANSLSILKGGGFLQKSGSKKHQHGTDHDPQSVARSLRKQLEKMGTMSPDEQSLLQQLDEAIMIYTARKPSLSFLQVSKSNIEIPAAVLSMCEEALHTADKNSEHLRSEEKVAEEAELKMKHSYEEQIASMQTCVTESKSTITETNIKIIHEKSEEEFELELRASMEKKLAQMHVSLTSRTAAYREIVRSRSDEIMAAQEALQILSGPVMQYFRGNQSIGAYSSSYSSSFLSSSSTSSSSSASSALSLLQVRRRFRKAARAVKRHAPKVSLQLLSLGSKQGVEPVDPFASVKVMITTMIKKLEAEISAGAKKARWCDVEKTQTTDSLETKTSDLERSESKISNMNLTLQELNKSTATETAALISLQQEFRDTQLERIADKEKARHDLFDLRNGVRLVGFVIDALNTASEKFGKSSKKGFFAGIISLLDIALKDFKKQLKDRSAEEELAEQNFRSFSIEAQTELVRLDKKTQRDTLNMHKTQRELMRFAVSRKTDMEEFSALKEYMTKLDTECAAKVDSYAERKAARDAEIQALKDALLHLKGEMA